MAVLNLQGFTKDLRDFGITTREAVIAFQKKIAFEALNRVTNKTPVDTGRARGNWQLNIGTIPDSLIDITGEKEPVTSTVLERELGKVKELGFGQIVYVINNVNYITFLEQGSSEQARNPDGMVQVTIEELRQFFR